jgi:hypothetical protein
MMANESPGEMRQPVGPDLLEEWMNTWTPAQLRAKAMQKLDDATALRRVSARTARGALREELEAAQLAARADKLEAADAAADTRDDRG